jgi:hypothetical protein
MCRHLAGLFLLRVRLADVAGQAPRTSIPRTWQSTAAQPQRRYSRAALPSWCPGKGDFLTTVCDK